MAEIVQTSTATYLKQQPKGLFLLTEMLHTCMCNFYNFIEYYTLNHWLAVKKGTDWKRTEETALKGKRNEIRVSSESGR